MPFILSQRWISDTESELGLGTVVSLTQRRVTLLFSATGETRIYSRDDPPVTRVIFSPDDIISHHQGWQLKVTAIAQRDGLITYTGTRLDSGETDIAMPEGLLDSQITFSKPQDRLFAGQSDRMDRFVLRLRARHYQSEQFRLPCSGLRGVRASLIPHQLHIAYEVGQRHAPRVLLADEVGLGKTIEAGMIVRQQLLAGRAQRVLIVVPESLQHQWLVEMLRRFNLHFALFDESRYRQALHDSANPFATEQWIICSLNFVSSNQQRLAQLITGQWDLLVVDEAHHLRWDEGRPGHEYQVIEQLAEHIPGVLLLTATPEQSGHQSHFARLRLLDPKRFHSYDAFVAEQQKYRPIADAVGLLLSDQCLSAVQQNLLAELIDEPGIIPLLQTASSCNENAVAARHALIRILLDRHGTSRVLFRNTRNGVKGFPRRCLQQIKLPLPDEYHTLFDSSEMTESAKKSDAIASRMLCPERIYQERMYQEQMYQESGEGNKASWQSFDPRVAWLLDYLCENANDKVLVICAHAATAQQLEQVLREKKAIRAALFHEGMSLVERDRAAAWFSSREMGAQVLLCSETGSEGRNFQFSSQLVMFDLPFNPDLLEQRIGRLDRIGQQRDIQIMVPYLENSAQAVLVRWYHEGLNAFEQTCATGRAIFERHWQTLADRLMNPLDSDGVDKFIHHCRRQHEELKLQLEQGRDRLLEMHSSGAEQGQQLARTIAEQEQQSDLASFACNLFDIVGINQENFSDNLILLTPSDHLLVPDFPGLPPDGCTVTFDRERALLREEVQFMSWEHPLIRNGLDFILSGHTGCCAVALLKNRVLPVGTMLLELVYVAEAQAPKRLALTRFLPPTPVWLLLDSAGCNLADRIEFENFNCQLSAVNRHASSKLVKALQREVQHRLQLAEVLVKEQVSKLVEKAKREAEESLTSELNRLQALQAVNPNIRADEIEAVEDIRRQVLSALHQTSWRLDAIRLVVVSHQ